MTVFGDKLAGLGATLIRASGGPIDALAKALRDSRGRTVIAVGSGGSAVAAEFLLRCRSTLGLGRSIVQTPMELVPRHVPLDKRHKDWTAMI
jgi:hypothetical protein